MNICRGQLTFFKPAISPTSIRCQIVDEILMPAGITTQIIFLFCYQYIKIDLSLING